MVTITAIAEQKIKELMADEKDIVGLRVYVKGGGCHGYQYGMAFESKMADDDTVETLSDRILVEEHRLYPEAIGMVLDGRWAIEGRRFVRPREHHLRSRSARRSPARNQR